MKFDNKSLYFRRLFMIYNSATVKLPGTPQEIFENPKQERTKEFLKRYRISQS